MRKIIKLADFFTIANLIFGLLTIFYAIDQQFTTAAIFLLIAVLFDFIDGKIARATKTSDFGKQLDSLADLVSFGVAPAIFGLGLQQWYSILILLFFVIAGMLRLARFNVTKIKGFEGVPITWNGLLFPLLFFIYFYYQFQINYFLIIYAIMGILMISKIKIKKLI